MIDQVHRSEGMFFRDVDVLDVATLALGRVEGAAFLPAPTAGASHVGVGMQAHAERPALAARSPKQIDRVEPAVVGERHVSAARHKVSQPLDEVLLQISPCDACGPVDAPSNRKSASIRQRSDQQAPLARKFQRVDKQTQRAIASGGFLQEGPGNGSVAPVGPDRFVGQKATQPARSAEISAQAGLLSRPCKFVRHVGEVDVSGSVEPRNQTGKVSMPGLAHRRKRLVKQDLDPMLKVKAVAHRTGAVGRSGLHLQPHRSDPVMQQPVLFDPKLSGS
jgi:hypothetical protein